MMKYWITTIVVGLTGAPAMACISLSRTVAIKNSPFFFDSFDISGYSFSIPFSSGAQTGTFRCERQEDGTNQWILQASDDTSTPEDDAIPAMPAPEVANGQPFAIQDTTEVPRVTTIQNFVGGPNEATLQITSTQSTSSIRLRCSVNENRMMQMVAEFVGADGNVIGSVGAAHNGLTRGLSMQREADATVDFANLSAENLSFSGCGGARPTQSGQGSRVNQ